MDRSGRRFRAVPVGARLSRRASWLRPLGFVVLLAAVAVAGLIVELPSAEALRAEVARFGDAAPLALLLVYAAATLAPLPRNVLSAACGLLLGFAAGVLVAFGGSLLGAVAGFGLGRSLGRDVVERLTGGRVARVDALLARRGLVAVLITRLLPMVPFTAVTYATGLTAVRFRDYLLGTALGVVPGTVAYVALGAYGTSPSSWPLVAAVLGLSLVGAWLARHGRAGPVHRAHHDGPTTGE